MTQNNLGNALAVLGERESGLARLKEAVSAYRQALKERTRKRLPLATLTARVHTGMCDISWRLDRGRRTRKGFTARKLILSAS